jgi:hypothetical protein
VDLVQKHTDELVILLRIRADLRTTVAGDRIELTFAWVSLLLVVSRGWRSRMHLDEPQRRTADALLRRYSLRPGSRRGVVQEVAAACGHDVNDTDALPAHAPTATSDAAEEARPQRPMYRPVVEVQEELADAGCWGLLEGRIRGLRRRGPGGSGAGGDQ